MVNENSCFHFSRMRKDFTSAQFHLGDRARFKSVILRQSKIDDVGVK